MMESQPSTPDTSETRLLASSGNYPQDTLDRLLSRVRSQPNGCWMWTGSLTDEGYGQIHFWINKRKITRRVSRVSFEIFIRTLGKREIPDHLCRNRGCINPTHMEPVSNRTNVLRGVGPTARNARKTHCKRGHAFTPENTYTTQNMRHCRKCRAARMRTYRAAHGRG